MIDRCVLTNTGFNLRFNYQPRLDQCENKIILFPRPEILSRDNNEITIILNPLLRERVLVGSIGKQVDTIGEIR